MMTQTQIRSATGFLKAGPIPAHKIIDRSAILPKLGGIYLFFAKGGLSILRTSAYFACGGAVPITIEGYTLLYIGAASNLANRIPQHLFCDLTSSSLRGTLLALQLQLRAISKSRTRHKDVKGERTLTRWLATNAVFAISAADKPFAIEREAVRRLPAPFNIMHRREEPYARLLSALRCSAFPAGAPSRYRKLRAG